NLWKHVEACFNADVVKLAKKSKDHAALRVAAKVFATDGDISRFLKTPDGSAPKKTSLTPSHKPLTKMQTRAVTAQWVCENLRSISIVEDDGFKTLMLSGRPGFTIPSRMTVSRDIQTLFKRTRERWADFFKTHQGRVSLATDCWTSPNH
ncbi:uncharacterized protein BXZ73DRAFT_15946, partial [Epithele typhae]